jgi:succinate dehydrogenase / fumarate reductase flavoprotein subunit
MICTASASSMAFQQGACWANGEFIQVHPTAIPGADKLRLISESVRGEGGRVWVPKDPKEKRPGADVPEGERDYFLEAQYPGYGNLVPRDIASRALFKKCFHEERGIYNPRTQKNELEVYLDVTHLPRAELEKKLAGVLEIYEKFASEDPYTNPMRVFPAVHYSMGGLWVDFERSQSGSLVKDSPRNQATSIPGLYAVGEADYQYHGANRLGANSLLSCIYGGLVCGPAIAAYQKSLKKSSSDVPRSLFDKARTREEAKFDAIVAMDGDENPFALHAELAETMLRDVTIERDNTKLAKAREAIDETSERLGKASALDPGRRLNQSAQFVRHLQNMIVIARVIVDGAIARDESRGAHFKPAFPTRNDAEWLRTTLAMHELGGPRFIRDFDYECAGKTIHVTDAVDTSLVKPRARKYDTAGAASTVVTPPSSATAKRSDAPSA